jgi:hypothetical protein
MDYLQNMKKKLNSNVKNLANRQFAGAVHISSKMRQTQSEMKALYDKQKKAGGIIENVDDIIVLRVNN